jgi:hypothetical protein
MKYNLLPLLLLLFVGCKKDVGAPADTELPTITITSPMANQVFTGGQTISINGVITDNTKLREIHLEITNTTTGAFLTHEHYAPDAAIFTLTKTFTAQASSTYKIKVEAEDPEGNKAETEITVTAN